MSTVWTDFLTPEQSERFGAIIDSRVRLLGEPYGLAVRRLTEDISDENRAYVLGTGSEVSA